jgi:hypothetical protein
VSFAGLLTHPLAVVTPTVPDPDDLDDRGYPVAGTPTTTLVNGLVQPRTAREIAAFHNAGAEVSTHIIFLQPMALDAAAYIRDEPDTGRRFQVVGVRSLEFGSVPHLEVDATLVGSTEGPS